MKDNSVTDFLSTMSTMSKHTANEYAKRLNCFKKFVLELRYQGTKIIRTKISTIILDKLLIQIKTSLLL